MPLEPLLKVYKLRIGSGFYNSDASQKTKIKVEQILKYNNRITKVYDNFEFTIIWHFNDKVINVGFYSPFGGFTCY